MRPGELGEEINLLPGIETRFLDRPAREVHSTQHNHHPIHGKITYCSAPEDPSPANSSGKRSQLITFKTLLFSSVCLLAMTCPIRACVVLR